jgi:hypothetical protein
MVTEHSIMLFPCKCETGGKRNNTCTAENYFKQNLKGRVVSISATKTTNKVTKLFVFSAP